MQTAGQRLVLEVGGGVPGRDHRAFSPENRTEEQNNNPDLTSSLTRHKGKEEAEGIKPNIGERQGDGL